MDRLYFPSEIPPNNHIRDYKMTHPITRRVVIRTDKDYRPNYIYRSKEIYGRTN